MVAVPHHHRFKDSTWKQKYGANVRSHSNYPRSNVILCRVISVLAFGVPILLHCLEALDYYSVALSVEQNNGNSSLTNRSNFHPILPGEFFLPKLTPSEGEVEAFFRNPTATNDSIGGSLQEGGGMPSKVWTCHHNIPNASTSLGRDPPLVFLHQPRAAGASVRALLRAYSSYCGVSLAVVANCLDVGYNWIMTNGTRWVNSVGSVAEGTNCAVEYLQRFRIGVNGYQEDAMNREPSVVINQPAPVTWGLLQGIEILLGRIPIGLPGDPAIARATYITIFRDPLEQWVSLYLLWNDHFVEVSDVVASIRQVLVNRTQEKRRKESHYFPTSSIFITPYQKEWMYTRGVPWTPERRLRLAMKNLETYPVVIGIVERWHETLSLFQAVLDLDQNVTSLFRYIEKQPPDIVGPDSSNLTAPVVDRIRDDDELWRLAKSHLRYEQFLYDYAYERHRKQLWHVVNKGRRK